MQEPGPGSISVSDHLAVAAWAEADMALAMTYRNLARLETALAAAQRARSQTRVQTLVREAGDEALALRQYVSQATRLRGLFSFEEIGSLVAFDAARHEPERGALHNGDLARVVRQGVARSAGGTTQILSRATVRRARTSR